MEKDNFDSELSSIIAKQRQLQIEKSKLVDDYFRRLGITLANKMGYPTRGEFTEGKIDFNVLADVVEKGSEWYKQQYPSYKAGYEERQQEIKKQNRRLSREARSLKNISR